MKNGGFVISLDFELMWGVRDRKTVESYGSEIKKVQEIVPRTVKAFRNHGVKGTFATVGILLIKDIKSLGGSLPELLPSYADQNLSPYKELDQVKDQPENPYYFCSNLIQSLKNQYPEQEIASHTFSHYYCLEEGQSLEEFEADLKAAQIVAKEQGLELSSIVFPRNQTDKNYINACKDYGITSYRGVEKAWFYQSQAKKEESKLKRAFRLLDCYVNISGHNTFNITKNQGLIDIPASRFLRPYSQKLSFLEKRKVQRIKAGMTHAAKNNQIFHLWWHPHNFGAHTEEMFNQLEEVLTHFDRLQDKYGFQSYTMKEIADQVAH